MARLSDAIHLIRPEAVWVLRGLSYENLEWLDEVQTKPTKKEIDDAIKQVKINEITQAEAQATAKAVAQSKLAALGLTVADLEALGL